MEGRKLECVTPINTLPFLRDDWGSYVCDRVFNGYGPRLVECFNACIGIDDPASLRTRLTEAEGLLRDCYVKHPLSNNLVSRISEFLSAPAPSPRSEM
jgi:hypothetical protein